MAYSQQLQIWCLPYFHTWCGLSANLECRSQMCCTRLSENTGCNNYAEKSPSVHHRTTLPGSIFATKALLSIGRKLVKQQYLLHMSSQYDELRPINIWNRLASLVHGTPIYFNGFVTLGFVTAPTSLSRAQPNFAQCLAVSWGGTLYIYIHFWGLLPHKGILPGAKFTLRPSLAFSYIGSITAWHLSSRRQPNLAAWYKEWNYGTFAPHHFQQRAPPMFGGWPLCWE